jgi:hypothetical protein
MKLIYTKDGEAVADQWAEKFVLCLDIDERAGRPQTAEIANEVVILAARTLHVEGRLCKTPLLVFEDALFLPDKNGKIAEWPPGFCDTYSNLHSRLAKGERIERG